MTRHRTADRDYTLYRPKPLECINCPAHFRVPAFRRRTTCPHCQTVQTVPARNSPRWLDPQTRLTL